LRSSVIPAGDDRERRDDVRRRRASTADEGELLAGEQPDVLARSLAVGHLAVHEQRGGQRLGKRGQVIRGQRAGRGPELDHRHGRLLARDACRALRTRASRRLLPRREMIPA